MVSIHSNALKVLLQVIRYLVVNPGNHSDTSLFGFNSHQRAKSISAGYTVFGGESWKPHFIQARQAAHRDSTNPPTNQWFCMENFGSCGWLNLTKDLVLIYTKSNWNSN